MEGICWSCCAFGVILNIFIFKKVWYEVSDLIPVYTSIFISCFFNSKLTLNSRVLVVRQIITFMHSIIVITCANVCWKDFTILFLHFSCNSNISSSNVRPLVSLLVSLSSICRNSLKTAKAESQKQKVHEGNCKPFLACFIWALP